MAALGSVLFFAVLVPGFANALAGECGFPGRPLQGAAYLDVRNIEVKEFNWKDFMDLSASNITYRCPEGFELADPEGINEARRCQNGQWSGTIPLCAEPVPMRIYTDETLDGAYCLRFRVPNDREYRFNSIRLTTNKRLEIDRVDGIKGNNDNYIAQFHVIRITYHLRKTETETIQTSIVVFIRRSEVFNKIRLCDSSGYKLDANIQFNVLGDECGHPEIPINGRVEWNHCDTTATYRCDQNFQLESDSNTRQCVKGQWTEPQLTCARIVRSAVTPSSTTLRAIQTLPTFSMSKGNATEPPINSRVSSDSQNMLIGVCCGFGVIIIALLFFLCYKQRVIREVNGSAAPPSEAIYDAVYSPSHYGDSQQLGHVYDQIRYSQVGSRAVPEGSQGYEIPNHLRN